MTSRIQKLNTLQAGCARAIVIGFGLIVSSLFSTANAGNENSQSNNANNDLSSEELDNASVKASPRGQAATSAAPSAPTVQAPASSRGVRRFHEVLDELLAEFGYDVRMGQLNGLKNLAVRRVDVSEALPKSYESYIEMLVDERIRENSQLRLINCLPCRTRTSSLIEGKLKITSPSSNITQLNAAAEQLGIENFMDVVLVYHTNHMVLAFQIFNTGSKELVWARAYNSETIRSRFQKLAVDYSQVAKARTSEEYIPDYKFLVGFGAAVAPNPGGSSQDKTFVMAHLRGMERFNNRKDEFGLMMNVLFSTSSVIGNYPTTGVESTEEETVDEEVEEPLEPAPFTFATGFYGVYAHNFIGRVESYSTVRHGFHLGLGGIFTSGYLAGSSHIGWDVYFGRRFAASFGVLYIAPTDILLGSSSTATQASGGIGGDLGMSINF